MVFRSEPPNPGIILIKAKKASAEWRIRHKLTQTIQLPNPTFLAVNRKKIYWITWKKPQGGFIKINFDGSKSSQGTARGFIIRN